MSAPVPAPSVSAVSVPALSVPSANNANSASTIVDDKPAEPVAVPEGHVRLTIDGVEMIAPKGELLIRTAERMGTAIPRFCDHPLLEPVGACRQCLVEVEMGGRPMPKPQAACTQAVAEGMVVKTQLTSPVAEKAQRSNLEFLLLNHPLDCPVCDKGGECPLQNQTMANGSAESRMIDAKRTFTKPLAISTQILLDRERCVLCQRCTRFSDQIAGDNFIELLERGTAQQIGISADQPFQSYFSGNTIQICPVGALTSEAYRFRARPFDLLSTPGVCEHCASGCATRVDWRRGAVMRKMAALDLEVNEEWNCDKGRFAFTYVTQDDRLTRPLVRSKDGELVEASWTDAMAKAAAGLSAAVAGTGAGVLTGGRLTVSDAYAYSKFARLALRTNNIDFRTRVTTAEEEQFLGQHVVGVNPKNGGVTYEGLEKAKSVLLIGLEPEEESPILFLRLRKAWRHSQTAISSVAALTSRGLEKMGGVLIPAAPGQETAVVQGLAGEFDVVLVGERAAEVPGLLTAAGELARASNAKLAWVPRRAGDRGAVEAGAVPSLLPGGRPVSDDVARVEIETSWGASVPATEGLNTEQMLRAAAAGELDGLVIAGVSFEDLPDPSMAVDAVHRAKFVVCFEQRRTAVTELADVVFPVAASVEKAGAYLNWEGRLRPFDATITGKGTLDDARILDTLGVEMDVDLYTQTPKVTTAEMHRIGSYSRHTSTPEAAQNELARHPAAQNAPGHHSAGHRLATWQMMLDGGSMLDGETHLAGTARADVIRLSTATAAEMGATDGDLVQVWTSSGSVTLPLEITDMVDGAVWMPSRTGKIPLTVSLRARHGDVVNVAALVTGGTR
ncbi:NADH-quinone oxidoreductase subunit G [Nakamurella antarctica]|uniref:NADH-quinone oxidoreductase n=1 Tax=Nakamurella antarctica TaxID=1902245 RepID=A0A3G8ZN47_9ACTN|nr:NADH-quinone oxidoreductase subunit G [Nakamurella antarctica]AZI58739.1 NADH-quinone oxidoreductase subunit G [Nakamurella antarctica]